MKELKGFLAVAWWVIAVWLLELACDWRGALAIIAAWTGFLCVMAIANWIFPIDGPPRQPSARDRLHYFQPPNPNRRLP